MTNEEHVAEYFQKLMAPLVGMVVTAVGVAEDGCPLITFSDKQGIKEIALYIQRDSEGNDPGFPAIERI